jgi:hypothetical protein
MLSRAIVDIIIQNNATWEDAFQFGDPDDVADTVVYNALVTAYNNAVTYANANPNSVAAAKAVDAAGDARDAAVVASWNFVSQTFRLDVKAAATDGAALLSLTTGNGYIVVDDTTKRILHFNVPGSVVASSLPVGRYVYDLIMLDGSTPAVRVALMSGAVTVVQGVTGN